MADRSNIEWTEASLFGEPLPRKCSSCGTIKPWREFNVDHSRADGRGYVCRLCNRTLSANTHQGETRHAQSKEARP